MPKIKPVLLVVLDGWGIRAQRDANAIAIAGTPNMDALMGLTRLMGQMRGLYPEPTKTPQ